MAIHIVPSILSADFAHLGEAVQTAEAGGADAIQIDVMDGHFVPNITVGIPIVAALRDVINVPLDVHLMIEQPERYVDAFADAGADILTVHVEASPHLHRTIQRIQEHGIKAGVALNPATSEITIEHVIQDVDLVLVMTVNPGFGGQAFIDTMPAKIEYIRDMLDSAGRRDVPIEVDGGINVETAPVVVDAGATWLVAGSAVYKSPDGVEAAIQALRAAAQAVIKTPDVTV